MSYVLSQAQALGMIPAARTLASVPVPPAAASQSILEIENQQGSESQVKDQEMYLKLAPKKLE